MNIFINMVQILERNDEKFNMFLWATIYIGTAYLHLLKGD